MRRDKGTGERKGDCLPTFWTISIKISDIVSNIKTFLIHGHVSTCLILATLVPIVKTSLVICVPPRIIVL